MIEYEITGSTDDALRKVPVGARFRYKTGKTWYTMLPHGEYQNAIKPGNIFWAHSHGGWFDNIHKITTLVVERR